MSQELLTPSVVKQMAEKCFCVYPDLFIVCSPLLRQWRLVYFYNFGISLLTKVHQDITFYSPTIGITVADLIVGKPVFHLVKLSN